MSTALNQGSADRLGSQVYRLTPLLTPAGRETKTAHPIFSGSTGGVRRWSCHLSLLMPHQASPALHQHDHEEILVVLDGELEVRVPGGTLAPERRTPLRRGEFAYCPARFPHAARAAAASAASVVVIRWRDDGPPQSGTLGFERFDAFAFEPGRMVQREGWTRHPHFSQPTGYLRQLRCHVSTMQPGAGYPVHADPYDVVIVTLAGEIETIGARVPADSVIFYAAGEPHGLSNPGDVPAVYVVFEFHSLRMAAKTRSEPSLLSKVVDPRRWARMLKAVIGPPSRRFAEAGCQACSERGARMSHAPRSEP
jgi:quercetin dioxygenase-like cupin family protein